LPREEVLKKIAEYGRVTIEWILRGEGGPPEPPRRRFSIRTPPQEEVQARTATYEAPEPGTLNLEYLARSIILAWNYLKKEGRQFTDAQEAQLISYIYEHLTETHEAPARFIIHRLADLIPKKEDT